MPWDQGQRGTESAACGSLGGDRKLCWLARWGQLIFHRLNWSAKISYI